MKTVLLCSILFCAIALPGFAELTDADLDKIRLIVNEELKPIEADIVLLKTDTAWIRGKLESVDKQFEGVNNQFTGVNNQITHSRRITYGLIALIVVAVGIPQIVMAWRSKKDSTQEKQIEELKQEVEELKQQPVFSTGTQL